MAGNKVKAAEPETIKVYPSQSLLDRGEYLAGVGLDGAEVSRQLAEEYIAAGLASLDPSSPSSSEEE